MVLALAAIAVLAVAAVLGGLGWYRARIEIAAAEAERRVKADQVRAAEDAYQALRAAVAEAQSEASSAERDLAEALRIEITAHRGDTRAQSVERLQGLIAEAGRARARLLGDSRL